MLTTYFFPFPKSLHLLLFYNYKKHHRTFVSDGNRLKSSMWVKFIVQQQNRRAEPGCDFKVLHLLHLSNQSALTNVSPGSCWSAWTRCHLTGVVCHSWPISMCCCRWCNTADRISACGCRAEGLRRCPPVWTEAPNLCQRPLCLTVRLANCDRTAQHH